MSYTKTALLPVTPDEAFALLTDPERLRRWQTVSAVVDLRAGGSFRWTVTPGHVASGTFREVEPGRRLVFGWGWDGSTDLPSDASTVTVTIEPAEGGSRVTLVHEGLNAEQAAAHAQGWTHYLERLTRVAATGDAGSDPWAYAPENLTPVVAADAVLAALQPVLRALTPQDQAKPTPCADFTCHELAEHLLRSLVQLAAMAGTTVSDPGHGTLEHRVSTSAGEAIDAWRGLDLDAMVPGPGGVAMPASFLAAVLPVELALHGWDLAQAGGQTLRLSDEVVDYLRGLAETVVSSGRGSAFADETVPADDASAIDRLAAFAGRTPMPVG